MIHLIVTVVLGVADPAAIDGRLDRLQQAAQPAKQAPARSQADVPATTNDATAEAYYQFMTGRRLAADGESAAAIKALRRAMALDPASSHVPSVLAELYARQGQMKEAIALAEAALKLDANNWDAHRLLGMIYADMAERGSEAGAAAGGPSPWQQAVDHLEAALGDSQSDMTIGIRLALGRMYLQHQNYDKGISTLKQLLADSPWLPQGVALLAETYNTAGKPNEAIALLKDAVQEEPSFYSALGEAYDKQQRYAEAASAYEKASEQSPRDGDLKTRWAAALLNRPETAGARRARDLLIEVTKTTPNATWPLYLLARAQRFLDDLDGAEATARRILAISPTSTSGAHALAQVFESRRQYSKIVDTLAPIVTAPSKGREADAVLLLTHLGVAYLELGRGQDAAATFERALQLDSADTALKANLAQALMLAGQYDRAIVIIRELRAGRSDDLRMARMEADALKGQGKFDAGLAALRPVAEAAEAGPTGAVVLSDYYVSNHRYEDAATVLKAAQAKYPRDLTIQFEYGAMLERLKRFDEAERVLRQVIAADAENAPALNYLGYTLVERGQRIPEALDLIKRAVKVDPYNGSFLDSLGWAHFKLNQLDLAEASLRTAAEQLVRDSVVQDHFGDVLAAKGRTADAIEAWRRSLAGDGERVERSKIERKIRDAQARISKQ